MDRWRVRWFGDDLRPRRRYPVRMVPSHERPSTRERLEEILREIGTLLVAFAPLDAAFAPDLQRALRLMLLFLLAGIFFIHASLLAERRR